VQTLPRQASILDTVYVAIRDAICDGEFAPGARITQDDIAERLGVSRQPVVQAMVLLKSQGFVSDNGRRGLIVTPVSAQTVRAIYQLRGALDETAASLAAERAHVGDLAHGWEILAEGERLVARGNIRDLVRCDMAFHEYIYELSGNPLIRPALEPHLHQLRRVMTAVIERDDYRARLWREHAAILEAIQVRDAHGAGARAREHVAAASQEVQDSMAASATE